MKKEHVILLHGMAESSLHMKLLELRLLAAGYSVTNFDYPTTRHTVQELGELYVMPVIEAHADAEKLHIVTHSLGGVVIRYCFENHIPHNLGRVVMHAPAHHGSNVLELYRHSWLFSLINGPVAHQSGTAPESCYPETLSEEVDYELGIIAGCTSIDPLSAFLLKWPHDGRTSVEGTKLEGMTDHVIVPSCHEFITFHPLAVHYTLEFLNSGQFTGRKDEATQGSTEILQLTPA